MICVGKLYNRGNNESVIARYAQGRDYHDVLREGLETLAQKLSPDHAYKICVDTAPLLERSYARQAGLGWIGKNTCLINQPQGSWFFLGEIITTLEIAPDQPPPDRCGTCTRCIDACPTQALNNHGQRTALDARLCIAYLNIELRGPIPVDLRSQVGQNVFGCDICQDVCPWNSQAPLTADFAPLFDTSASLQDLSNLTQEQFRETFRNTPVTRAEYHGFLRNVATAMGSAADPRFIEPLQKLELHSDPLVAEHARWARKQIESKITKNVSKP